MLICRTGSSTKHPDLTVGVFYFQSFTIIIELMLCNVRDIKDKLSITKGRFKTSKRNVEEELIDKA
jgi:hypothetical protein